MAEIIKKFTSVLLFFFFVFSVSSQSSDVNVKIVNSPPTIRDVTAYSQSLSSVPEIVWCSAVFEDLNTFQDIADIELTIALPQSEGFKDIQSPKFTSINRLSVIRGEYVAGFVVDSDETLGPWICMATCRDSAGDVAQNTAVFKLMPPSCGDGILNGDETGIDCGGPCLSCDCSNQVKDEFEEDIDCGGNCNYCKTQSLRIIVQDVLEVGDMINIQVMSEDGGMAALVRITDPSGKFNSFHTDDSGVLNIPAEYSGNYVVQADLLGYKNAKRTVLVNSSYPPYVVVALAGIIIFAVAAYILFKKKRKPSFESKWSNL